MGRHRASNIILLAQRKGLGISATEPVLLQLSML